MPKSILAEASPQTPLGELTSPRPLDGGDWEGARCSSPRTSPCLGPSGFATCTPNTPKINPSYGLARTTSCSSYIAFPTSGGSSFSALGWPVGGPADIMEGPMATM